uniref:Uncharacterized protein n=1 Tax=Cyprinus carpio TaxID=7962 RepID=A0A8C1QNZ0_CYPCA
MVVLLLWKNADGFKGEVTTTLVLQVILYIRVVYESFLFDSIGVAYSSDPWDQPPDTLPLAVQSSMSETHVTGTLPVEEVGSTLFPNKPLKSRSNRSGTQLATSSRYVPVQGGSSTLSLKPLGTLGRYTPMSPTKYIKGPTSSRTTYGAVSQVGSLSQMEASGPLLSQGGNHYSGLLPQSQAASGQYALGYSKPISSPQGTSSQSASVLSSHKQPVSASQGSFGAQFGALQGMSSSSSGSIQSQGTLDLYCKCALPPLDVGSQTTPSSHKRLASSYGTQSESIPFTLQGSVTYDGSPQPKVAASQFALVSQSYPSVSSQGVASQSTTVRDSQKPLTSTYTGSSGTQAGSSTPVTLHHAAYGGSSQPQHTASQFSPGLSSSYQSLSLSSPLGVARQSSSWKQFTSASHGSSGTQAGSSFTLQGSTAYGGSSPQDASQSVPGSSSPYASVSLPSPQGVASQSNQAYQGYSVSQSQKSQRWQPLAAHWTQGIQTSDAAASQGSSSSSSPMHVSSLSSARGSSRVSSPLVSALGGSTSYDGSFRSQSLSTKYTPGSQLLSYDPSVAGQGTSSASASEISSSYSSMNNQNVPVPSRSSSSRRFYSIKG